jgi:CubicO group peptidase (beta-lactamase class C family)
MAALSLLGGCHVGRYFFMNTADTKDQKRFPAYIIDNAPAAFEFTEAEKMKEPQIPEVFNPEGKYADFNQLAEENKTLAFIVIRNDSLLYENYFNDAVRSDRMAGFSIAKSFVSALTGIAIEDGFIKNVDQPVTDFLSDFKHPGFDKMSLKNLLNMRSGIKFSETYYNPFGDAAKFYYGRNLERYAYKLKVNKTPGTEYYYNSANTLILAMILEKVTGRKLTDYFEERIWTRIGTSYPSTWNYDSEKHGMVKAFCCTNAAAIDFAKFGRLYLNGGNWEGEQIIPKDWVDYSMGIHNDSRDSENYPYTYFWRVLDNGAVFAKGILGQYIYLDPSKNLIIVRFGNKRGKVHWSAFIEEVAKQY